MTSIVYGIVRARRTARDELPPGLDDAPISAVVHGEVEALLSPLPEEPTGLVGAEGALAYARVIERLHQRMTILPMRFGCFVPRPEAAAEFLRRHEKEFSDALSTLDGCDEMSLRVLLPDSRAPEAAPSGEPGGERTGTAYLANRRRFYERKERADRICQAWAERAETALAGTFRKSSWERAARPEGMLLSLSFLVEKRQAHAFLEACRKFRRDHEREIAAICTGPMPPYVFVAGLVKPGTAARAEREFLEPLKG